MGYFFAHMSDGSGHEPLTCQSSTDIIANGGTINENPNGVVTVYNSDGSYRSLTKSCCEVLKSTYTFDFDKQECRWGENCIDNAEPFQLMLNPIGNSGTIFNVDKDNNETCILNITFDYLFQLDCDDIYNALQANQLNTLNNETQEHVNTLSGRCEEINILIGQLEYNQFSLNEELANTPYVIQCNKPITEEGEHPQSTPTSNFNTLLPPNAFPHHNYGLVTYCLTEEGLSGWESILGTVDYSVWLASEGTNTSLYTCTDVDALIAQDGGTGELIGTCDVSVTARQEIITHMNQIQHEIIALTDECANNEVIIADLLGDTNCNTFLEMLESFDVSMTVELVDSGTLSTTTVYEEPLFNIGEGNLFEHFIGSSGNTGFYVSGTSSESNSICDPASGSESNSICQVITAGLVDDLLAVTPLTDSETETTFDLLVDESRSISEFGSVSELTDFINTSFNSSWLNANINITDQSIISGFTGQEIKISLKINECCMDFGILIDRINMNKECTTIESTDIKITKCPSFDMVRVCDNKKSWLANEEEESRDFDLKLRGTEYDIKDYRLAINSKEVDLDINPSNAIEQDLWCYVKDNSCLLDCTTGTTSVTAATDYDFAEILIEQAIGCEPDFAIPYGAEYTDEYYILNSGCTATSNWSIDVTLGCETIYSNDSFYVSTGITDTPTQDEYVLELSGIATTLGLEFTSGATSVTFTDSVDCDESRIFLNETFKINLGLDISTLCPKQFQDGDTFLFQDGGEYEFN